MNAHSNTTSASARTIPASARSSDSLDDLTSDLRHLATLVGLITNLAIDIVDPGKTQCNATKEAISKVSDLLWIARDMVETIADNSNAAHERVLRGKGGAE